MKRGPRKPMHQGRDKRGFKGGNKGPRNQDKKPKDKEDLHDQLDKELA